jgi:fluoroacetyl-CoA thioesterase
VKPTLQPGLTGTLEYRVPAERTVPHLLPEAGEFSGMPRVLATGYLIGLVEWACMRALRGHLDDGERTVGVHVDVSHEAPTPPGGTVRLEAELTAIDHRRLSFTVLATDDAGVVCRGVHQRAVINLDRFERNFATRTTTTANQPQA